MGDLSIPPDSAEFADGLHPVPVSARPSSNFHSMPQRSMACGLIGGDEKRLPLRRIVGQLHGVGGFHMREHFVEVSRGPRMRSSKFGLQILLPFSHPGRPSGYYAILTATRTL
jgi:hypothetical protein